MSTTRTVRRWLYVVVGGVVVITSAVVGSSQHHSATLDAGSSSSTSTSTPSASASPAARMISETIRWGYKVTGYAPAGADITYGNDSDNRQGYGMPFHATIPGKAGALYQDVTAQLQGSGDITAKVYEIITARYSDGTSTHHRQLVASAHASGGYNIANAEYTGLDAGLVHLAG